MILFTYKMWSLKKLSNLGEMKCLVDNVLSKLYSKVGTLIASWKMKLIKIIQSHKANLIQVHFTWKKWSLHKCIHFRELIHSEKMYLTGVYQTLKGE